MANLQQVKLNKQSLKNPVKIVYYSVLLLISFVAGWRTNHFRYRNVLMIKTVRENQNPLVNPEFLMQAMSNDRKIIHTFIDIFLDQFPEDMDWVTRSVQAHDLPAIQQSSHHMKSTVSLMGIHRMEDVLTQMERLSLSQENLQEITALYTQLKEIYPAVLDELYRLKLRYC